MRAVELANRYRTLLNNNGINTPLRLAHFFAQIDHESGGFRTLQENLNYSVDALLRTFGRHRISEAQAREFGRSGTRPANQQMIANILYGGTWGKRNLGNTQPNDGWNFRGRGFKQITGRANYTRLSRDVNVDYVTTPDRLLNEADAMISACWFWRVNNCNRHADADNVVALSRVINGGTIGLQERKRLTNLYKTVFR